MTAIASTPPLSNKVAEAAAPNATLGDRFVLAQVQSFTLVIPANWVTEILRVERSQILPLPFYSPLLLGIIHQGGRVLPLLSAHSLLKTAAASQRETNMVVKLGDAAGSLAQVGLVIDLTAGIQTRAHLPSPLFTDDSDAHFVPPDKEQAMVLLRPEWVSTDLWRPLYWRPSSP